MKKKESLEISVLILSHTLLSDRNSEYAETPRVYGTAGSRAAGQGTLQCQSTVHRTY